MASDLRQAGDSHICAGGQMMFRRLDELALMNGDCFRVRNEDAAYVFLSRKCEEVTAVKITSSDKHFRIFEPQTLARRLQVKLTQRIK